MARARTADQAIEAIHARSRVTDGGCWEWTGPLTSAGYGGMIWWRPGQAKEQGAHRVAYVALVGEIQAGLIIDHRCHNEDPDCPGGPACRHRRCVNPAHLEPVTAVENLLRSPLAHAAIRAAVTTCPQGHEFTPENTYQPPGPRPHRTCRTCRRAAVNRHAARQRELRGSGWKSAQRVSA